jgi:hypothetical protein
MSLPSPQRPTISHSTAAAPMLSVELPSKDPPPSSPSIKKFSGTLLDGSPVSSDRRPVPSHLDSMTGMSTLSSWRSLPTFSRSSRQGSMVSRTMSTSVSPQSSLTMLPISTLSVSQSTISGSIVILNQHPRPLVQSPVLDKARPTTFGVFRTSPASSTKAYSSSVRLQVNSPSLSLSSIPLPKII